MWEPATFRWTVLIAAGALVLVCEASASAAPNTLTFSDGICAYRVAFDPKKLDRQRLKDTLDYLAGSASPLELGPPLSEPGDVAGVDVAAYRSACATHRKSLEGRRLIDDPAIEDVRRRDLAALDDGCAMTEAELRAAKGELGPLRAYAPTCSRYVDSLGLPADRLKAGFGDMVDDLCKTSAERGICMGYLQKESEKPQRDMRMRLAILTQGWAECARRGRPGAAAAEADSENDRRKRAAKEAMLKRLKVKTLSCAQ